jgi:aconitase A
MAEKWIQGAIKRPGAFTEKAKAAGMSVQEYAAKVTAPGSKASTRTKKQANLAKTLRKIARHSCDYGEFMLKRAKL